MPLTEETIQKWKSFKEYIEGIPIPFHLHSIMRDGVNLIDHVIKEWREWS